MSHELSKKKKLFYTALLVLSFVSAVEAATFNAANGDWSVAGNWDPVGLPGAADIAAIDSSRVCNFNTTSSVGQLQLGVGSNGTLNMSGGSLTTGAVDKSLWIGGGTGTGTLTMTGGAIVANNRIAVGGGWGGTGNAVVDLSGDASIAVASSAAIPDLMFAYDLSQSVTLNISGTASISAPRWFDFRYGNANITQTGGSVEAGLTASGILRIGWGGTGTSAVWTMTGGTIEANMLIVGNGSDGLGILNLYGGAVTTNSLSISPDNASVIDIASEGVLNVKDLSVSEVQALIDNSKITGSQLQVNTVDIDGTMYTQVVVSPLANVLTADFNVPQGNWSVAGNWDPQELPFTNDTVGIDVSRICNFNTTADVNDVNVGVVSNGTLNVNGGELTAVNLNVGSGTTGLGAVNLQAGTVTTDNLSISSGNASTIEMTIFGILNVKNLSVAQVTALMGTQIIGSDLSVRSVDIDGTTYTQVYSDLELSLNVTIAKNCSPVDISGGDCVADLNDLETMAGQWLDTGAVVSDISGNNVVDLEDFAMLAAYWLDEGLFETPTDEFTVLKSPDSSSYTPGSSVSLIAIPEEGWRLDYWSGDLTSGSYIAEIVMNSNKNISAVYSQSNAAHDEIDYANLPIIVPGQDPIISESPYIYERDIYGYNPSFYPGEPAFDSNNNPYIRFSSSINDYTDGSDAIIQKLQADGSWQIWNVLEEARRSYPAATGLFEGVGSAFSRIVIDEDDWVYTVVRLEGSPGDIILYKLPEEETWRTLDILSLNYSKLEPFEGYSPAKPPIVIGVVSGGLKMLRLSKLSGSLTINKEIDLNTGIAAPMFMPTHSGSSRVTATVNNKTWFCFASMEQQYDTNGDPISGTPQYISSYDHARQTVSDPILLGFGQNHGGPAPDNHNGPAMVADSAGLLHVVMGAHNDDLGYTHSTATNPTSISDWTTPVTTGISGGTYPSLVIDSDDTLHLVARDSDGRPQHLVYARAERSGSTWTWDDLGYMVIPWHDNYSIYYQKLSIDKYDRLFLFYHYYHNYLTTDEVAAYEAKYGVSAGTDTGRGWYDGIRAQEPAVLMSDDGGDSWRLSLTGDFLGIVN